MLVDSFKNLSTYLLALVQFGLTKTSNDEVRFNDSFSQMPEMSFFIPSLLIDNDSGET